MNEKVNKFLTEAMGGCWHSWTPGPSCAVRQQGWHECIICGATFQSRVLPVVFPRPDYFTWPGFGSLWTWAKGEKWWERFCAMEGLRTWKQGNFGVTGSLYLLTNSIDPLIFPVELAKFLGFKE